MSWVCSRASATPIAAKPSRSALPKWTGWKARTPGGVVRTAAASRAPVASITWSRPALSVPSGRVMRSGRRSWARPARRLAYAAKSSAMWKAVVRQLHSRPAAFTASQSRSSAVRSAAVQLATAAST